MDADRFDSFARSLSADISRRRYLIGVSGVALGGLASLLGPDPTEAGNHRGGRKGRKNQKNKRKKSNNDFNPHPCDPNRPLAMPCGSTCCDPGVGQTCCNSQVCCPSGKVCCGSRCCDYCSPEGLCGICPPCTPPDTCINGYCKSCDPGYTICIQPNGAPVCCHTNPPDGTTPMICEGGYCVRGED